MSTTRRFNGTDYTLPDNRQPRGWGTQLSAFLIDVADNALSKAGGNFTLATADINFGTDYGLVVKYVKYSSGTLMLNTSGVVTVPNATDTLVGKATTDTLTNKTLTSPVINTPTGIVKADVGLSNVDNTSDANKPVSTATQTELNLKAPIANPTFTGTVAGVTATMVGLGNVDNTSNATERAATATLTNKTLTAPILDQAVFTEAAAPSTPASGKLAIYAKTDSKLYKKDDAGVETEIGAGAGGAGEKNYVTNPSGTPDAAAAVPTGWANVGDLDVVVTKTVGELPRRYTTATGIKISADANTQSVADYVYFDFTLDDVDLNKKLKIEWSQKLLGAYTAGQLAVVITTQADRTTALHTPVTTAIPAADGVFTTSFDSSSTATLSLVIRATADMATDTGIVISDVVVGPGTITQGAAVGSNVSYAPTVSIITTSFTSGNYYRSGEFMHLRGSFRVSGTGAGSTVTYSMPSGLTINSAALPYASPDERNSVGSGSFYVSSSDVRALTVVPDSTTALRFATTSQYPILGSALSSPQEIFFTAIIPIAEWAGSGTVNLGAGSVEYAYNSSTANSNDTSSFAYGPSGVVFGSYTSTATSFAVITKRVRFQYPIQEDDQIVVELNAGNGWQELGTIAAIQALQRQYNSGTASSVAYGMYFDRVSGSTTDLDINFGSSGRTTANTGLGTAGETWASVTSFKWRVRKAKAGAAVGFGMAGTDGSAGLYKAGLAPGLTTGAAIPAGYVGEMFGTLRSGTGGFTYSTRSTTTVTTGYTSLVSITLNKGVYLITAKASVALSVAGNAYGYIAVGATQVSSETYASAPAGYDMSVTQGVPVIVSTDSTAVALYGKVSSTTGLNVYGHEIFAIRIA